MRKSISDKVINLKVKLLNEKILSDNYSYEKVCAGICSESYIREVIKDNQFPDMLVVDSLMQRVGLRTENYESVISREEYNIIKKLDEILEALEKSDMVAAQFLMTELDNFCKGKNVVYEQLSGLVLGVSRLYEDGYENKKLAYVTFVKTIKLTIGKYTGVESIVGRLLHRMELILHILIFMIEANDYKKREYKEETVKKINMEMQVFETMREDMYNRETARILAYYGEYIAELAIFHDLQKEAEYILENSLKMIINTSRMYNSVNLLRLYSAVASDKDKGQIALWISNQLEDMYNYYNANGKNYRWCIPYGNGEVYAIDWVIKIRRKAMNMSQEELAVEICTGRTISNIENGKCNPKPNVKLKILKRLGVNYCDYGQIESFEVSHHHMLTEYSKAVNNGNYDISSKMLKNLRRELPDTNVNRQFIEFEMILENIVKRKKRYSNVLCDCINALERTCKVWDKNIDWIYTAEEVNILYNIAELQFRRGNNIKAQRLFNKLLKFYKDQEISLSHFVRGYTMAKATYSSWLGNLNKLKESIDVGNENMDVVLRSGGTTSLANQLYDIGWDYEQLEKEEETLLKEKNGIRYMKYAYAVALMNNHGLLKHIEKNVQAYYSMDINPIC